MHKGAAQRRHQANEWQEAEAIEVREIIEQASQQEHGEVDNENFYNVDTYYEQVSRIRRSLAKIITIATSSMLRNV